MLKTVAEQLHEPVLVVQVIEFLSVSGVQCARTSVYFQVSLPCTTVVHCFSIFSLRFNQSRLCHLCLVHMSLCVQLLSFIIFLFDMSLSHLSVLYLTVSVLGLFLSLSLSLFVHVMNTFCLLSDYYGIQYICVIT